MTKEEFLPYIMLDADEFWANSVNPINSDSLFIQAGITNIQETLKFKNSENGIIVRALFENTYLVKGEYIITFMKSMVLTNKRLFTFYTDVIKSIALKNILRYEHNPNTGLILEYVENGNAQSIKIGASVLRADTVNNSLATHQRKLITDQELILLSDIKIVLDAKYDFAASLSIQSISQQSVEDAKAYKRKGNRNGIIALLVVISLIGGCGYWIANWNKSYEQSGQAYGGSHQKKKKKCPWCGGIGRVGYAGDSKAQIERTGMGLGNYCTTCTGTGYVDDDN